MARSPQANALLANCFIDYFIGFLCRQVAKQ
jgi:hypothetical protein